MRTEDFNRLETEANRLAREKYAFLLEIKEHVQFNVSVNSFIDGYLAANEEKEGES